MSTPRILILEARFYEHIADKLTDGAVQALEAAGAQYERLDVPGALEIPSALSFAIQSEKYDAYIVLGCVIRGETNHYDIVCNESARGIYAVALAHNAPVGNGILTVENEQQAIVRADPQLKNKGADAAMAALKLWDLQQKLVHNRQEQAA